MSDDRTTETAGWRLLSCDVCGEAHRDDCPNRYERVASKLCSCSGGCNECDWTGTVWWTTGGHKRIRPKMLWESRGRVA